MPLRRVRQNPITAVPAPTGSDLPVIAGEQDGSGGDSSDAVPDSAHRVTMAFPNKPVLQIDVRDIIADVFAMQCRKYQAPHGKEMVIVKPSATQGDSAREFHDFLMDIVSRAIKGTSTGLKLEFVSDSRWNMQAYRRSPGWCAKWFGT